MSDYVSSEPTAPRPFSDLLMEAATRAHELPREELARLLVKAAIRLRVAQQTGLKLEHIPVAAYHLLRRISRGPIRAAAHLGDEENGAISFLLSRDLIARTEDGLSFEITAAGEELGEIADERPKASALEAPPA